MRSRQATAALFANPFLLWGTLGVKAVQMSTAAAQVIAIRTTRIAAAGLNPTAADRRESPVAPGRRAVRQDRAGGREGAG